MDRVRARKRLGATPRGLAVVVGVAVWNYVGKVGVGGVREERGRGVCEHLEDAVVTASDAPAHGGVVEEEKGAALKDGAVVEESVGGRRGGGVVVVLGVGV